MQTYSSLSPEHTKITKLMLRIVRMTYSIMADDIRQLDKPDVPTCGMGVILNRFRNCA